MNRTADPQSSKSLKKSKQEIPNEARMKMTTKIENEGVFEELSEQLKQVY